MLATAFVIKEPATIHQMKYDSRLTEHSKLCIEYALNALLHLRRYDLYWNNPYGMVFHYIRVFYVGPLHINE